MLMDVNGENEVLHDKISDSLFSDEMHIDLKSTCDPFPLNSFTSHDWTPKVNRFTRTLRALGGKGLFMLGRSRWDPVGG